MRSCSWIGLRQQSREKGGPFILSGGVERGGKVYASCGPDMRIRLEPNPKETQGGSLERCCDTEDGQKKDFWKFTV